MTEHTKTRENATMQNYASQPWQSSCQVQCRATSNRLSIQNQIFLANTIFSLKAFIYRLDISICIELTWLPIRSSITRIRVPHKVDSEVSFKLKKQVIEVAEISGIAVRV
nr:hypothetical protein Iba_chr13aCG7770 [Ipomoea batatas]